MCRTPLTVNCLLFTVKFTLTPARRGGREGRYSEYQVTRMIGVFWGGWNFCFRLLFWLAWLKLGFFGYLKQSGRKEPWERVWRNPGRIVLQIKYNQTCWGSEILHGRFRGLIFGPGIFLGFDFCPHSIIPNTWNPEYPPPPPLGAPNGSSTFSFSYVKNVFCSNKLTRCWPCKWRGSIYELQMETNIKKMRLQCYYSAVIANSILFFSITFLSSSVLFSETTSVGKFCWDEKKNNNNN